MAKDLLGDDIPLDVRMGMLPKGGYPAMPGSANNDKTCGDCIHYRSVQSGSRCYPKCGFMRDSWTAGSGSDIKKSAAACSFFNQVVKKHGE